ncbi:MAG: hypothetical protein IH861_09900 [Chloroflexi bacterium]|nr:hypothetical protein [Chloroflexota bacterium]
MINESDGSQDSQDDKEDQEIDDSPTDPMLGQFEGVIGAAIEKAVSQYRALLSQGLDTEVKRIVTEFEVATADIDQTVAKQTRARLTELIEDEVRAVFDDTLGEAEQTFADPIWRTARDRHIPYLAPKKSESEKEASISQTPSQANPTEHDGVPQPDAPESESENVEGPKPLAPPSPNFWVFPSDQQMRVRVQEEPDQVYSPNDEFADAQQPSIDDDEKYTDALSVDADENSDLETVIHDNSDMTHIAANEDLKQEPVDDSEPGPLEEIDDEELMVAEALDFEDLEEPEWVLPDNPYEISDDWSAPVPITSEDLESAEAIVVESDEKSPSDRLEEESTPDEGSVNGLSDGENTERNAPAEEETAASPANGLEPHDIAANPAEEEVVPANGQTLNEDAGEVAAHADVIEEDEAKDRAEVVAGVAEGPTLKTEEPEKVISAVEGDVQTLADAIEEDEAKDRAEVVAGVAEGPTLKTEEPEKVISAVEGDVQTLADAIEDDGTKDQTEVVASVAERPALKADEPSEPENDQAAVFEGTVRLNVEAPGCVKEIVQFVRELRQKPQLRLLRLVGNNLEGVDIWLGLREPLNLGTILPEMQGVTIISKSLEHVGGPDERLLSVRLIRNEAPQNSGSFAPAESMPVENPKVVA